MPHMLYGIGAGVMIGVAVMALIGSAISLWRQRRSAAKVDRRLYMDR